MKEMNSHQQTVKNRIFKQPISQFSHTLLFNLLLSFLSLSKQSSPPFPKPPPLPILPLPSASQLSWQLGEMSLFLHFGTNTFTNSEWGSGHVDPSIFNPTKLDAHQWVSVAKESGFSRVLLTVKHHDGFCLWPSSYTNYSVRSSPWKNGNGDVLSELAIAAREEGIGLGIYLSPWDRHEASYGKTLDYNEFYLGQMTELLTGYGEIKEVFLDGAKGKGEKDMEYFFDSWFSFIHQLQPGAVIFSDGGPDTRWVGDEAGVAGSTCWSVFNGSSAMIGHTDAKYSGEGDPQGHDWVPAECDVSIRPGWFWHSSEVPKSAISLLDIYYKSVGRNCHLLLNVPPNSSGLISDEDIKVLQEFTELRRTIFSRNLAKNAVLTASSIRGGIDDSRFQPSQILEEGIYHYWAPEEAQPEWVIYLDFGSSVSFNMIQIQEPIQMGQRVSEFHVDILIDGLWQRVIYATTIGYRRLIRFPEVETQQLRLVIDKSRADPLISYLGIYLDTYSILSYVSNSSLATPYINGSRTIQQTTMNHSSSTEI